MDNVLNFNNYAKTLNNVTFVDYYNKLKMLAKSSFEWENLPNNIDEKWIEDMLFHYGKCMFFKDETLGLMVAKCTEGGFVNHYDEPTKLTPVATNFPGNIKQYENNIDCVLIRNNDDMIPTQRSVMLYAYRLTVLSRTIDINIEAMKTPVLINCTDKQKNTLKQVYKQWNGCEPVIFGSKDLETEEIKVLKTDAPIVFDKLQIEKNHIWNECMTHLGINNANMDKRERLVDDEVQANNEQIEMFALSMLKSRQEACKRINSMFGTNINVKFRNAKNENIEELEGGEDNG